MGRPAGGGRAVTRQTWTALVAALTFVLVAIALVALPVPFVTWGPGGTRDTLGAVDDKPMIEVQGIPTHPTSGRLDLTVVAVTPPGARLSLPQALLAYWLPHRDTLPLDSVYAPGKSAEQAQAEDADMMSTAQDDAVVAALRADRQPVSTLPAIFSVTVGAPAHTLLLPGDLVLAVDEVPTPDETAVGRQIRTHRPGDTATFRVVRQRVETTVRVPIVESTTQEGLPVVGITLGQGYRYQPRISFELGQRIGGPSAGLVFALAIYDKITTGELLAGRHVAGTGSITPDGEVGSIGGIQEKIAGAEDAGATVFLVPAGNCGDLVGVRTDLTLVKVSTLRDAVGALETLQQPGGVDGVPRC
jgi:PDZ domain-containing protein